MFQRAQWKGLGGRGERSFGKGRKKGYKSVSRQEGRNLTVWVVTRKEGSEACVGIKTSFGRVGTMAVVLKVTYCSFLRPGCIPCVL